jgi:hypothetical protein
MTPPARRTKSASHVIRVTGGSWLRKTAAPMPETEAVRTTKAAVMRTLDLMERRRLGAAAIQSCLQGAMGPSPTSSSRSFP